MLCSEFLPVPQHIDWHSLITCSSVHFQTHHTGSCSISIYQTTSTLAKKSLLPAGLVPKPVSSKSLASLSLASSSKRCDGSKRTRIITGTNTASPMCHTCVLLASQVLTSLISNTRSVKCSSTVVRKSAHRVRRNPGWLRGASEDASVSPVCLGRYRSCRE